MTQKDREKKSFTTYTDQKIVDGKIVGTTVIRTPFKYSSDLRGNITLSKEVLLFLITSLKERKENQ